MPTIWTNNRLGGDYLLDWQGNQILDWNSESIITIVPGGYLGITILTCRPVYHILTYADLGTQTYADLGAQTYAELFTGPPPTSFTGRVIP